MQVNAFLTDLAVIRTVQELLGHGSVETTMIDTHVLGRGVRGVECPADQLGPARRPTALPCWADRGGRPNTGERARDGPERWFPAGVPVTLSRGAAVLGRPDAGARPVGPIPCSAWEGC
jgi:hypothetical protein